MKIGLIDVDGYDGKYKVSANGDVYSMFRYSRIHGKLCRVGKPKKMKPSRDKRGYLVVNLYDGTGKAKCMKVHRLVAMAFLDNPDGKRCVCHKDNNPRNCAVSNLYWGTDKENQEQAWMDGLHRSECSVVGICQKDNVISGYRSQAQAARCTGVPQQNISKCIKGVRKTAGGYIWRKWD